MAKVMISLPDDLLERLDERAKQRGTTRSGFLRDLSERELAADSAARLRTINTLLAAAESHGGGNARYVRQQRLAR